MSDRPESPPTRALAWLYSQPQEQPALALLCALEREIGASVRRGVDHAVAHARLGWWREELARFDAGAPRHPITRELRHFWGDRAAEDLAGIGGLLDIAAWDLAAAPFANRGELAGYCERWSAAVIVPLTRRAAPAAEPQLRMLGRCLRELELLLALAPDARDGRLRLPLDELDAAGVLPGELVQPVHSAALVRYLRARHQALRRALANSVAGLDRDAQAALRGLLVWVSLATYASARVEARLPQASLARDPAHPLDGWRAWSAARRAISGRGFGGRA